ncbi:MAG: hypothetical protein N4A49_07540 [Marinifilaceae bacterium]|jgi:hypothetical protein|nr:hypothetical protein [Marinifilaceae bacterium]
MIKRILLTFAVIFCFLITTAQDKTKLTIGKLLYKQSLLTLKSRINGPMKVENKYVEYEVDYGWSNSANLFLPLSVKHPKFKLLSNINYYHEFYSFKNIKPKIISPENYPMPSDRTLEARKMLISLKSVNILNLFNRTVVLTSSLNTYSNSDIKFKKISGMMIITIPRKKQTPNTSFNWGLINLLRENGEFLPIPMISYAKLYKNKLLLNAVFPYKLSLNKIYNEDFNIGIGTTIGAEWPMVDLRSADGFGSNGDIILNDVACDTGINLEKRLNKYFVLSAETGIRTVFQSEIQDENKHKIAKNDNYNNLYFSLSLMLRIKK